MNKAFVREPDADARVLCPKCGSVGTAVGSGPLDAHIQEAVRSRMADSAWYCSHADCDVAYLVRCRAATAARQALAAAAGHWPQGGRLG